MNSFVKNRYVDALLKLMLLSAIVHMLVLAFYSLLTLDISRFNFFSITALDLFFPSLVITHYTLVYSFFVGIVLYSILFVFFTKKKQ